MKKANEFVSFKFGDIQKLEIMNFFSGANSLDSFLKAYNTKETKDFFPYEWFDCPEKITIKSFLPITPFLASCAITNPLKRIQRL